jgi:hypothetical protein
MTSIGQQRTKMYGLTRANLIVIYSCFFATRGLTDLSFAVAAAALRTMQS